MHYTLFLAVLLCTGLLTAQRAAIDVAVAGGLTYRARSTPDRADRNLTSIRNDRETTVLNGYAGVHYALSVGPKTFLRTGLRLTGFGSATDVSTLRWGSQHGGGGGFDPTIDPGDPNAPTRRRTDHFFADVPLLLRRTLGGGVGWTPYVETGLLPGIYLTTRTLLENETEKKVTYRDDTEDGMRRLHLGGALALGLSRSLGERYVLFVQPVFRYQLTALAPARVRERPFSGSLEAGVRRALRR